MDNEETMVEQNDSVEADDALPEDIVEEQDESEESLDSLTEDEGQPADETKKTDAQGTSEPGWIKQRVNKAVQKAVAETEARMRSEFDRQMAPIREKMLNDEAKELVRQGEFKSLDRAKEYLKLKQGQPAESDTAVQSQQPRQTNGQFAPKRDPGTQARINMLGHQAAVIKEKTGLDVTAEFVNNDEIKQKVISGEMDFYDVADHLKKTAKKRPPAPVRSPNGASGTNPNTIDTMSDEQFERMEKRIKEGARYSLR